VHERVPRVGKYTSLLSRGSSYGRRDVAGKRSEISVARGSAPVRDSSASGMPASGASERSSAVRAHRGIGASHPKNFNLGIFRINERRGAKPRIAAAAASSSSRYARARAIYPSHRRSLSRENVISRFSSEKRRQILNESTTARLAHSCGFIRSPCFTHEGFESGLAMPA